MASVSRTVTGVAFYTWGPTSQMQADVQDWLDNPASNFGWLLRASDETSLQTARGFDSRQSLTAANRPVLEARVREFERVQRAGRATRELGGQLAEKQATLQLIQAEHTLRGADEGEVAVILRRVFVYRK